MPLDITLLSAGEIYLFGASFISTFSALAFLLSQKSRWLRAVSHAPHIYYGGSVIIATTVALAMLVIHDASRVLSLIIASMVVAILGSHDEASPLSAWRQFISQSSVVALVIAGGWVITHVTNPFGPGVIYLQGIMPGTGMLVPWLVTAAWLLLLMNAMNWLDGSDGLAPGVGTIAFFALAAVALLPSIQHDETLKLAFVGAGSMCAMLLWNFPPARLYIGTSGSWFLGLFLGLVALNGGGKIVTTSIILLLPMFDLARVAIQRMRAGVVPWQGDTFRHGHHRLLHLGLSPRQITIAAMTITALLGIAAILLETQQKIIAIGLIAIVVGYTAWRESRIVRS